MRSSNTSSIIRPDLGMAVTEYLEGPTQGLIGLKVMPIQPVPDESATFKVIPKETMMKIYDTRRADRGTYNRSDWNYEEGFYRTKENGWEELIDDKERARLERTNPGLADFIATKRATNMILKNQEIRVSNKIFNSNNFTAHAITNEWDDYASATPIANIKAAKLAFLDQCGMLPDALIINYAVFENSKSCAEVKDLLKYTYPGMDINNMTSVELARLFGLPQVFIGGAMYDSAGKGVASVMSGIWSDEYAALVKICGDPQDVTSPGVGWTFLWTEDSPQNPVVEQYREEDKRCDVFRVRHNTDEALIKSVDDDGNTVSDISAACVYLMSNLTTH
jgi:hypothetical protein